MTFIEIDDSQFQCIAAGIGGVIVPESLTITECCQDPDNLNIVYVRCSINGIYKYEPHCSVSWDGNTVDVTNLFIPNYKGVGVDVGLIDVGCGSGSFLLAYNVGSVIADFNTISNVTITLQFMGLELDLDLSPIVQNANIFVSTNPTASTVLLKGLTPKPYRLYFDSVNNQLKVQYSNLGNTACLCAINCVTPNVDDYNLTTCDDEIQEISIDANSIFGDPTNADIVFQDSIGNSTAISIQALINVKPAKPNLLLQSNPLHVNVVVYSVTVNGTVLDPDKLKYQILRYENNPDNVEIWKDWTSKSWKSLYDRNIVSGRTYGYAVRFQGEFEDISYTSDWATIEVT